MTPLDLGPQWYVRHNVVLNLRSYAAALLRSRPLYFTHFLDLFTVISRPNSCCAVAVLSNIVSTEKLVLLEKIQDIFRCVSRPRDCYIVRWTFNSIKVVIKQRSVTRYYLCVHRHKPCFNEIQYKSYVHGEVALTPEYSVPRLNAVIHLYQPWKTCTLFLWHCLQSC